MVFYRFLMLSVCLAWASSSSAITYFPRMDEADWKVDGSPFECRMEQTVPVFGQAVFARRAGERQRFYLLSQQRPAKKGKARLISDRPEWGPSLEPEFIAKVHVYDHGKTVQLKSRLATRLLAELEKGRAPKFEQVAWYNSKEPIHVRISSVSFREAYQQYQHCLASLLPVNFDQIKRTRLHFQTDKWDIDEATRRRLDNVILYSKTDTDVNAFFVDGHTDNVGKRLYNYDLSKRRAEAVTAYLVSNGIPAEQITTRYHGERYPVKKNNSPSNRRYNRRVTIRLERTERIKTSKKTS